MLKERINEQEIKTIFDSISSKKMYLKEMYITKNISIKIPNKNKDLDNAIINTWDYDISKEIIRSLYKNTDKYIHSKRSYNLLKKRIKEWNDLKLGKIEWPFSPMAFDSHIRSINSMTISSKEKDQLIIDEVIRFRRIKEINTLRNDYIEYLIVENNDNIIPTLKHNKGIDFYIEGIPYDQKVSRSPTKKFIEDFKDINYKMYAIKNKNKVAEYLYKYQDSERFGYNNRLLVVYLDQDVTDKDIIRCFNEVDFSKPIHLNFTYDLKGNKKEYQTNCYVILLYTREKVE